ncbi:hypothetical protein Tco_0536833 [Tanacetum coccineum]
MMTYLKHVGNKKHADLKTKSFDEIKALYEKVKRFNDSFITIGSTEDERKIKEMNEGASDPKKKKKFVKDDVSTKIPAKQDVAEQSTKKRKGGHMKMIARKRKISPPDVDSDDVHIKCLKIFTFEGTIDSEIMETKLFISKLDKVSSPEGDYLVVYRVNGNFRAFNYLIEVLHIFDRKDLFHLYDLVIKQYSESTPEGIELILWGDLKIMMESSIEVTDQGDFWNDQQDWEIVTWRLYEGYRVDSLGRLEDYDGILNRKFKDGTVIHMLVERKYPLSKELLQRMLDFGLEVEVESTAALDLIRVLNSPCFMVKSWLVQDQTVLGKDYSNLLIADSLLKTIWFINAPCYGNEALASPKANGVWFQESSDQLEFMVHIASPLKMLIRNSLVSTCSAWVSIFLNHEDQPGVDISKGNQDSRWHKRGEKLEHRSGSDTEQGIQLGDASYENMPYNSLIKKVEAATILLINKVTLQSKPSESDARSSDFNSCESNCSEETHESMLEPVVDEPKVDYPQRALQNKGIVDSGCSRHMTGNKAYLAEYQDFNGGPVAFGGSKGYITGKGKGPTWLFDLDYLTDSMNYQPVRSENQANKHAGPKEANHNAGTEDNIDAGDSAIEAESAQDYFVLPIWSSYTSTVKSSKAKNAGEEPNKNFDLKTDVKLVDNEDQVFLDKLERLKRQEHDANDAAKALRKEKYLPLVEIYNNPSWMYFYNASYDDDGAVADFHKLETNVNASYSTSEFNSISSSTLILESPKSSSSNTEQRDQKSKPMTFVKLYTKQRRNNHKDFQHCLFSCFLSQNKSKKISEALEDESWVDAMQEELLQFKIKKVWILVDLPYGNKAIRTK